MAVGTGWTLDCSYQKWILIPIDRGIALWYAEVGDPKEIIGLSS